MRFSVRTYGCQMNQRDSEAVDAMLTHHGYVPADAEADADVVIVNTCSIREKAEDKALGKLGLMVATKRDRPARIVGVIGCMVQRLQGTLFERVPGLDFAVGTHRLAALPGVLERVLAGERAVLDAAADGLRGGGAPSGHTDTGAAAFVNILYGCDRRCTYCVVPNVRGSEWSRPAGEILEEVRGLTARGVREVTLLGQSVMAYGQRTAAWPEGSCSPRGYSEPLSRLLEAVGGVAGVARVRFTSGHPSGCTAELARAMAELPAVCEHLHLPLQSGSDRILGLMRRGYTADGFRCAVTRLRDAMPGFAVTTDVIVGFPSESREEFERTRAFMDEIGFDNAFIFKYSPRPDTPASAMTDDVSEDEKMRRNRELLADQDRRGLSLNGALVGSDVEVLVEGVSRRNSARWTGRTRTNKIVVFEPRPGLAPGDLGTVRVERAMAQTLYGTVLDRQPSGPARAACAGGMP